MSIAVIIPWRAREGGDPLREQNLHRVLEHWEQYRIRQALHHSTVEVIVSDDGRTGNAPFNRSAAYNRATMRGLERATAADMLIFAEADLLVGYHQIDRALTMARDPGMVVPFSWFMALGERDSEMVRSGRADPDDCDADSVKGHRGSIGAINVLSRHTLDLIGGRYDEQFEGAWYDDDAMKIVFDQLAAPTRFVEGSAYHLYHQSGGKGVHLTPEDRAATGRNRRRLQLYRQARTPDQIRSLVMSDSI